MEIVSNPKFLHVRYISSVSMVSRILFAIQITSSFIEVNSHSSSFISFNKELVNIFTSVNNNEPMQIVFLLLGLDKNPELANEFHEMAYTDFNEPQFLFTNTQRMPRRSSYAPNQKVASVAMGKFASNYLVVIVIVANDNFEDVTCSDLAPFVRIDYDIFVIVGKEQILRNYFLSPFGMGLRTRIGIIYDYEHNAITTEVADYNPLFLVDPLTFKGGQMEVASHVPNFPYGTFTLNGRKLRVAANTLAPYIVFQDKSFKKITGGTHYGMLAITSAYYNFSLVWDIDPTRGNGKLASDGKASGMLGEVLNGKADIAFIARLTRGQVGVIDLTTSNYIDTLVFLSRKPEAHIEWTALIHIFTWDTWGVILLVFLGVIPIYYIQLKFTARENNQLSVNSFKAFMIPFGILITQSVPKIPNKAYLLTLFWLLYVLNLNIAYNCNLSSFLTKVQPERVPTSFRELANRLDYNISFNYINNGSCDCFYFFNDSTNPMIIGIQARFMPNLVPDTGRCIVRAILKPKNVCIGWESVTRIGIAQNATLYAGLSLVRVSSSVHSSLNSIGFRRHSIYTQTFDNIFGRFRDMGVVMYLKRQAEAFGLEEGKSWLRNRTDSKVYRVLRRFLNDIYANVKPFELSQFRFAYLLLFGGVLFGGASFIFELMANVNVKRNQRRFELSEFLH